MTFLKKKEEKKNSIMESRKSKVEKGKGKKKQGLNIYIYI